MELPEAKDESATITAISRVRAAHKANKEHKQPMWLVMSTSGIKILDFDYHTLRDSYALTQISYVTTLPSNRRVFAFVTANNTVMPPVYKCHVFKSNSRSLLIAQTMGRCFSIALEMQRCEVFEHEAVMFLCSIIRSQSFHSHPLMATQGGGATPRKT